MTNLTTYEMEILSRMKRGLYLIIINSGDENMEGLSINGINMTASLKAGTIESLLEKEVIYTTVNGRYLLTDKGRHL